MPGVAYAQEKSNPGKPEVVSLDYCADQFVLALADRGQIMALTRGATGEDSFYRNRARGLPLFDATTEQVLHMAPDIVIRNWGGYRQLPFLKQAGIAVVSTRYGAGLKTLYHNIRLVGAALGQQARAREIIRNDQRRLRAVKMRTARSPVLQRKLRAIYITPGGVTAGRGTFVNNIIKLAGLTSAAGQLNLRGWQPLPLEALIQNPPDLIIASFFNQDNIHVSNWSLSRHPLVRKMFTTIPTIMVPGRYLSCDGIFTLEAAEYIQTRVEKIFK
ncbi:MAG: ABC transporter substrate-binding protein [Alphaproteobacteria bacterium]|nr:ABC transporter substrate-binding protein [Alphaproteobacteria bacterium]